MTGRELLLHEAFPDLLERVNGMLIFARRHRNSDPHASMLHCRRALEVIVHHLYYMKFPKKDRSFQMHLAERIARLNLDRPEAFFKVNRIASSWIHWKPGYEQNLSDVGVCIQLVGRIVKEELGGVSDNCPFPFTIGDALERALSEANEGVLVVGSG